MKVYDFFFLPQSIGFFDSYLSYPNVRISPERITTTYEIEIAAEDGGTIYCDNMEIPIRKNRFFCFPPGKHRHTAFPYQCYYIRVAMDNTFLTPSLVKLPFYFDSAANDTMLNCVADMQAAWLKEDQWLYASKLFFLFSCLSREYLSLSGNEALNDRKIVYKARQYMENHFMESCSLSDIAAEVHLSPVYFHTLFKSVQNETPLSYLTHIRVQKAAEMLLTSNLDISRISEQCGFSSQSYFSVVFRQATGMPPGKYRKMMKEQYQHS